jgi:DNA-binding GntR family transcriptional regulator
MLAHLLPKEISTMNKAPASNVIRIAKVPLSEQAYEELKRQILDQTLTPGQRLNIDALSRACGISSSPLREALTRLGAEGLVVFAANTGFSVAPVPDENHMKQLMEFRLLIEMHCARKGCGDADAIRAMRDSIDSMAALRKKGATYKHYRQYIDLEQSFHQALVDSARNETMSAAWRELHMVISVARLSIVPNSGNLGSEAAHLEHGRIVAAFEAGDPEAAARAVNQHLGGAASRLRISVDGEGGQEAVG